MDCFNAISGKTKVCGIIGDPIEHTMSPVMHNAAFREMGLDYVYVPFRVAAAELEKAIAGMRALNLRGLNVTIPHKVSVIPLLDSLDTTAEKIGAVNLIVNDGGQLTGYNTDADGFLRALLEHGFTPEEKKAVILGAGGASRAVSFSLARHGAQVTILNRTLKRAAEMAEWLTKEFGSGVTVAELNENNLGSALEQADLLVNTTSVGMSPHDKETPVPAGLLRPGITVFDIVYNPLRTRLIQEAEAAGAGTILGIEMLVFQGALIFTRWTGKPAPVALMRKQAIKALGYEEK